MSSAKDALPTDLHHVDGYALKQWLILAAICAGAGYYLGHLALANWHLVESHVSTDSFLGSQLRLAGFIWLSAVYASVATGLLVYLLLTTWRLIRDKGKALIRTGDTWVLQRPDGDVVLTTDDLCAAYLSRVTGSRPPQWWRDVGYLLNRQPLRRQFAGLCAARAGSLGALRFSVPSYYPLLAAASVVAMVVCGMADFHLRFGDAPVRANTSLMVWGDARLQRLAFLSLVVTPVTVLVVTLWHVFSVWRTSRGVIEADAAGIRLLRGGYVVVSVSWNEVRGIRRSLVFKVPRWIVTNVGNIRIPFPVSQGDVLLALIDWHIGGESIREGV